MKSFKYLFLVLVALLGTSTVLSSCSKDDDEFSEENNVKVETTESSICGTWILESIDYGQWQGQFTGGAQKGDKYIFNEDHTYRLEGINPEYGTWTLSDNKVIVKSNVGNWVYTISTLTKNSLAFTAEAFGITVYLKR